MNDTSRNRTYQQLPDFVTGTDGSGNPIPQQVSINAAYPGMQIVTITTAIELNVQPPLNGQLIFIDARAAAADVLVRAKPHSAAVLPSEVTATVLAGTFQLVVSDGSGWRNVPDLGTDAGKSTLTSALARGMVDQNVPALATFAVSGAGRDGITYREDDLVVLNAQATVAENGPYLVGSVAGGNAALVRPSWWAAGSIIPENFTFRLSAEGTLYGGLVLSSTCVAQKAVNTDDPLLMFALVGALVVGQVGPVFTYTRGIKTVARNAQGDWTLTVGAGFDPSKSIPTLTPVDQADNTATWADVVATTGTTIRVKTYHNGALADLNFYLQMTRIA